LKYGLGRYPASKAPTNWHLQHIGRDFRGSGIGWHIFQAMPRWFLLLPAEQIRTANLRFQPLNLEPRPIHFRLFADR
jgi:hypothetical protein